MLRPILGAYIYHGIPITDDDLELFGFISEADKLTERGSGFKDYRNYNWEILKTRESKQRVRFIQNPRKENIKNYFHENLSTQIAYDAVFKRLKSKYLF